MNPDSTTTSTSYFDDPTHQPISIQHIDEIGTCWKCFDGGLTCYGETEQEAINELKRCRG